MSATSVLTPEVDVLSVHMTGERTVLIRPPDEAELQSLYDYSETVLGKIAVGFESAVEGMDLERVERFLGRYGLDMKPCMIVPRARMREFGRTFRAKLRPTDYGGYISVIDMPFVARSSMLERRNGRTAAITEMGVVHEELHANNGYKTIYLLDRRGKPVPYLSRCGLKVDGQKIPMEGSYAEEGLAGALENRYLRQECGLSDGFLGREGRYILNLGAGNTLRLPLWYVHKGTTRPTQITTPSVAAYGIEMLNARDPGLFETMLEARRSPETLRQVIRRINALSPGLYHDLRRLDYEYDDFTAGTKQVLDRVYDGDEQAAFEAVNEAAAA